MQISKVKMSNQNPKPIIFLNGKFLPLEDAKVSSVAPGFLYGFGLFETMRSYQGKIVYFEQHVQRIQNSTNQIGLDSPYATTHLKEIIKKTVKLNLLEDAYVRLTLWKSEQKTETLIIVKKYKPLSYQTYSRGFSVGISRFRQNESFLARLKTTSRILYELSFQEAKNKGFDEAIILNNRGYIAGASRSNLFLVKDNELFTPALECGCLNGITRKVIFGLAKKFNIKVYEGNFTVQDLLGVDEAFLTNSLMGIMPLTYIEKYPIAKGKVQNVTKILIKKYNLLLKKGT